MEDGTSAIAAKLNQLTEPALLTKPGATNKPALLEAHHDPVRGPGQVSLAEVVYKGLHSP